MSSTAANLHRAWRELASRVRLRACDEVGAGVIVDGPLHVSNKGRVTIAPGVWLRSRPAVSHLVIGRGGRLSIGPGVFIGHGAAIAAHTEISIGAGAHIGPFAMIMDTDFHEAGKHDAAGSSTPIHIGAGARLGARVIVLRGSTVGEGAVVAAGSVVKGDVPARAHVAGVPARAAHSNERFGARPLTMDEVRRVVAYTFGLSSLPDAEMPLEATGAWDSLGTLNLLLSLEEAFGVTIAPQALIGAQSVGDLLVVLEAGDVGWDIVTE